MTALRVKVLVSVIVLPLSLATSGCLGQSQSEESESGNPQPVSATEGTDAPEDIAHGGSGGTDEGSSSGWDRARYRELMAAMGTQLSDGDLEAMEANMSGEDLAKMLAALEGIPTTRPQRPVVTAPTAADSARTSPVPADDQALRERASMGDEAAICELARREHKLVELANTWEGEYRDPRGPNRTWNVDTLCDGWLLRMYANWGDVAPWLLKAYNDNTYEWHNPMGGSVKLVFVWDAENRVPTSVEMTDLQGETVTLQRLGPPKTYD